MFVYARDLDEMVQFYRDFLGLEVNYEKADLCAFLALPGNQDVQLAIYSGGTDTSGAEQHWFYVIDVPDVAATANALRERGVEVGPIEDVPYGKAATFSDPEGNVIEIHQRT